MAAWDPLNGAAASGNGADSLNVFLQTIGLGKMIGDAIVNQRNAAAYYQSLEGISNLQGQGERTAGTNYQAGRVLGSLFTTDESIAAFKGVTALGYNNRGAPGYTRGEALNFMETGKANWGQSVAEGLQTLEIASKSADINFKTLSASLDDVSKTAGKAGVNAQMARAQFLGAMDAAVQAGYGGGSTVAADITTRAAASYGKGYAQNVNNAGIFSSSRRYMVAARFGLTQAQAVNIQRKNPAQWSAMNSQVDQAQIYESFSNAFTQAVKQGIDAAGGASALKGKDSVAAQIGFDAAEQANENTDALMAVAASLSGREFYTPDAAMTWIVMNIAGMGDVGFTTTVKTETKAAAKSGMSATQKSARSSAAQNGSAASGASKKTATKTRADTTKAAAKSSVSSKSSHAAHETHVTHVVYLSAEAKRVFQMKDNGSPKPKDATGSFAMHWSP